jgi:type VII secretion protein EccE
MSHWWRGCGSRAPGAILQIVTHTMPAPDAPGKQASPASPASQSYQEVMWRAGPARFPRDRVTWVVVRLDARTMAENSLAAGPETQPPAIIGTLMRRLLSLLRRTGRPCRPLGASELLDALTRSCDLDPTGPEDPPPRPPETWTSWRSGRLGHATFWVRDWPAVARVGALLEALSTAPAALSSVALIMAPDGEAIDLRCLVRVGATEDQLGTAVAGFQRCAEQFQSHLLRLDGEHGPAAYASAPTGGGAR